MLSLNVKIDRAQRLLRMLEDDAPLLARRIAELGPDRQRSAQRYASELILQTRAELEQLTKEKSVWMARDSGPQPAD